MHMKRGAILIACGLLLVVLSTACSGTPGANAMGAATATSTTGQQTNGTTQIKGQDQRASGQSAVQVTPIPTKPDNTSNQVDTGSSQQSTIQATPTPAVNNKKSGQDDSNNSQNTSNTAVNNGNSQVATPTTTSGGTMYITTKMVTVNGAGMNVLTTGAGMTLYYRASDPAPASSCTGNCAATWPPLLNHNMTIIPGQSFSGRLTVQQTANGPQVEYNGRPLYTYVGDTASGQANGNGLGGVWYPIQIQPAKMHW